MCIDGEAETQSRKPLTKVTSQSGQAWVGRQEEGRSRVFPSSTGWLLTTHPLAPSYVHLPAQGTVLSSPDSLKTSLGRSP